MVRTVKPVGKLDVMSLEAVVDSVGLAEARRMRYMRRVFEPLKHK